MGERPALRPLLECWGRGGGLLLLWRAGLLGNLLLLQLQWRRCALQHV